jgi:hypothetical protein
MPPNLSFIIVHPLPVSTLMQPYSVTGFHLYILSASNLRLRITAVILAQTFEVFNKIIVQTMYLSYFQYLLSVKKRTNVNQSTFVRL